MAFSERLKELLDQGLQASKELAGKAGAKAQELGEIGVLKLEISQLEGRLQKLAGKLGAVAYRTFVEEQSASLGADESEVKALLTEITGIREIIGKKEAELKTKG
jgi:hypothetical protein